ncbi:MAG: hypothetical protein AB7N76_00930 [Planctomycetota bacterium]
MSNEPRLTKKEKKAPAAERAEAAAAAPQQGGLLGYLIGGALGLAVLFLLWRGTAGSATHEQRKELAHLAVMAEFDDLSDTQTRADLARFQRELLARLKGEVFGPLNAPILVPAPRDTMIPRDVDQLTPEELRVAAKTMASGGWLVPRLYSPDLRSAVFRVGPSRGGNFAAGDREKLEDLLKAFAGSKLRLSAYSHDLRVGDGAAKAKINAVFGVQTANAIAVVSNKPGFDEDTIKVMELYRKGRDHLVGHKTVRSITSLGNFWVYALAAHKGEPSQDAAQIAEPERRWLKDMERACRFPPMVDATGMRAWVMVTTSAEAGTDPSNLTTSFDVAANVSGPGYILRVAR